MSNLKCTTVCKMSTHKFFTVCPAQGRAYCERAIQQHDLPMVSDNEAEMIPDLYIVYVVLNNKATGFRPGQTKQLHAVYAVDPARHNNFTQLRLGTRKPVFAPPVVNF